MCIRWDHWPAGQHTTCVRLRPASFALADFEAVRVLAVVRRGPPPRRWLVVDRHGDRPGADPVLVLRHRADGWTGYVWGGRAWVDRCAPHPDPPPRFPEEAACASVLATAWLVGRYGAATLLQRTPGLRWPEVAATYALCVAGVVLAFALHERL